MGKRVILYLFLLFSLSLQAQTEEKVSLGNDSTEVRFHNNHQAKCF